MSNEIFYIWLVYLQTMCRKNGLEKWISPNHNIHICLFDMQCNWTKNVFWKVNNRKWRKLCIFPSPFLFNNTYGLPGLTMGNKSSNQEFYVWFVDLQNTCAKYWLETESHQLMIFVYVCSTCCVVELKTCFET
jgi:hypothetical protein